MTEMEEKRLWELVGKKIAKEASNEELEEFAGLLARSPDALYALETIGNYWKSLSDKAEYQTKEAALEKHLLRLQDEKSVDGGTDNHIEPPVVLLPSKRLKRWFVTAVAAALLLVCIAGWYLFSKTSSPSIIAAKIKTLEALKGSKNHFILPDGSRVWLNAGTTLTYNDDFITDSIREVFLSGEAFFEVRHDDKHPFWIHTNTMDIRDLGTVFNIKAYPADEIAEATLIEGSIEVKMKNQQTSSILSKSKEKFTLYKTPVATNTGEIKKDGKNNTQSTPFIISTAVPDSSSKMLEETAWVEDVLIFRNESFEDLAVRMERWYDISISFERPELKKYRFTGSFVNETVEQALKELQMLKTFQFSNEKGKVIIR